MGGVKFESCLICLKLKCVIEYKFRAESTAGVLLVQVARAE